MDSFTLEIFGLIAGMITSLGFIPQLYKGYKTKKLVDVSYYMPVILAIGMTMWLLYGIFKEALAVIVANAFAITCCFILIAMKKVYS
jgi:MtN3 and saliva related transmembrane protein